MALVVYNPFEEITINEHIEELMRGQCRLYISDLTHILRCSSENLIRDALHRTLKAMLLLNIPISHHIKEVYRNEKGDVYVDYRLSSLAAYLTIINTEPVNPIIARAQLYFMW